MKKWIAPLACLVACSAVAPALGDYYLYAPQEVKKAEIPAGESGILVKEIVIRRGDTLSKLSRTYSGRARWYPQILLFNKIRNPNLIFAGHTLRVPVRKEGEAGAFVGAEPNEEAPLPRIEAAPPSSPAVVQKKAPSPERKSGEQRLYDSAMSLFNRGKYRQALAAFDRFLTRYPDSAFTAEVTLRRAETYLRLSAQ